MSEGPLPVVYDRRRGAAHARTADLPPGAVAPSELGPCDATPVVLVHGLDGVAARDWFTAAPLLANLGLPVVTFSWTSDEPTLPCAGRLAALVDEVAERTGSDRVDLVGHSWGAVLARAVVRLPEHAATSPLVRRLVGLAPTYAGTTLHGLAGLADHPRTEGARAWLDAHRPTWREQMAGSTVLDGLARPELDAHDAHVAYTSIVTRFDQVVTPYRASLTAEPRAEAVVVQDVCGSDLTDHVAITHDAVALWHVVRALAPGREGRRPRGLVLPFVGGPASASTR
ncbi:alpha/beta fold hydrolase [Nocardioides flavescens]|uniref:Alpha/beta fold hydrolase n=1 Tax=Nocardioides flavescens TaxID=2691959 RepID=A0A6L7ELS7_9ACTN|nr:alpha/beta fold hydrolase [Nocardioides flavescens]